jgi:hypothetical protein
MMQFQSAGKDETFNTTRSSTVMDGFELTFRCYSSSIATKLPLFLEFESAKRGFSLRTELSRFLVGSICLFFRHWRVRRRRVGSFFTLVLVKTSEKRYNIYTYIYTYIKGLLCRSLSDDCKYQRVRLSWTREAISYFAR